MKTAVASRTCVKCVMDTTDPDITFDEDGVCNHCHEYLENLKLIVFEGDEGRRKLDRFVDETKANGKGKPYDCIIGLSGGVDSSYGAWLVKEMGLRPLAVHLDNGWNSELAVKNIHGLVNQLGIPLSTHVLDWEEFRDLQIAFLKSSTPDSEIPSDHAIFCLMIQMAKKHDVPIFTGMNHRTESHLPKAWSQGHLDWRYIKSVNQRFGGRPLKTFPHLHIWQFYQFFQTGRWFHLLNHVDFNKTEAKRFLVDSLGWRDYGGKHHESLYTRVFQGYILPKKFGYDKRKAHLSSLICSGEITREQALEELEREPYPLDTQKEDREYLLTKFGFTEKQFDDIMNARHKSYYDYPNYHFVMHNPVYHFLNAIRKAFK